MPHIVMPFTFIHIPIQILHATRAAALAIRPRPAVFLPIGVQHRTLAASLVVGEGAAVRHPQAMHFVLYPVRSEAVRNALGKFACKLVTWLLAHCKLAIAASPSILFPLRYVNVP
jgi:hypothetical protein